MDFIRNISPIDGRYWAITAPLRPYFSEAALISRRLEAECAYLELLCGWPGTGIRKLTCAERRKLAAISQGSPSALKKIKKTEAKINHDMKAVEYHLKDELEVTSMSGLKEHVHFALTSEDINNIAYALMLSQALSRVLIPELNVITKKLSALANTHSLTPLLARTHGQSAVGTTFGKEFRVFSERLKRQVSGLRTLTISVKFSGAAGNYNAHMAAWPAVDWLKFSEKLVKNLNTGLEIKLTLNRFATQIDPHDTYAELFDNLRRTNTVLLNLVQDLWRYISDGLIIQKPLEREVGSSAMPQKINPIQFENAEGNLGLANALAGFFSAKLPVSRLQRDLSDSTVERNFGTAFAHCLIAYRSVIAGLERMAVDPARSAAMLYDCPEIYAEGIQTILRKHGFNKPYETLKNLTRGRDIGMTDLKIFVEKLAVKPAVKAELRAMLAKPYIGLAGNLALMGD
ncbi:MAG TPA: adenylosuccinate lyase [Elusimicrobia bacterium]|nr:adenylosuccinate lyase [Elusimicrobiota bacterium]